MDAQQGLAERAASLRRRLQAMAPLCPPAAEEPSPETRKLLQVRQQVADLQELNSETARQLGLGVAHGDGAAQDAPLVTYRTRRLLLRGRELLEQLKGLTTSLSKEEGTGLRELYEQTLTMTEVALRSVQAFPSAAIEQDRCCIGLEGTLEAIGERVARLRSLIQRQQTDSERTETLAHSLLALVQNRPILLKPLQELAAQVIEESQDSTPIRWHAVTPERPDRWAAAHGLNLAQLMARLGRHDSEWGTHLAEAVLAALVCDAGMAAMPAELLGQPSPLKEEQRRMIEAHVGLSADGLKRIAPGEGWLIDAVRTHHERVDGTGYPAGVRGPSIPRLGRLLAVCDVYAALLNDRPYRPALNPRTALTETLLEAEKGRLDPDLAQLLLEMSFYPVGTVVELSDGTIGQVVATNPIQGDLSNPSRPVVLLLADEAGAPITWPTHVNLAQTQGRHIVRGLNPEETRRWLGARCWRLI